MVSLFFTLSHWSTEYNYDYFGFKDCSNLELNIHVIMLLNGHNYRIISHVIEQRFYFTQLFEPVFGSESV